MKNVATIALIAAAMAATPAAAQSVEVSESGEYRIAISYADLNLASETGMKRLEGRAKTAVNQLCSVRRPAALAEARLQAECRDTVARALNPQIALAAAGNDRAGPAIAASR